MSNLSEKGYFSRLNLLERPKRKTEAKASAYKGKEFGLGSKARFPGPTSPRRKNQYDIQSDGCGKEDDENMGVEAKEPDEDEGAENEEEASWLRPAAPFDAAVEAKKALKA